MHGIILAGGLGTRMGIFTKRIGNKHLMPVYDRVMIEFPINTLVKSGIKNITIVTGNRYSGQFVDFLGNGKEWGIERLNYAYQFGEGGIADALKCAEYSVPDRSDIAVILGDNMFEDTFTKEVEEFDGSAFKSDYPFHAQVFLKEVQDPERFGVAQIEDGKIITLVEKPKHPISNLAVTGLYFYDHQVFDFINKLSPSNRGELEVTDLNDMYLKVRGLKYATVKGYWSDMGTPDSLLSSSNWYRDRMATIFKGR